MLCVTAYIAKTNPGVKGFNRRGLYRMKQFYETYRDDEFVSPLVTQISWTNHLLIMSGSKSAEERRFYIQLCIKERYSKRELERQMDSAYYERYMLSAKKPLPEDWPWWNVPEAKQVKDEMQADPRWEAWVDKIKA